MHRSDDHVAREYAQAPRPAPIRLGMTRLANHDDEIFNSWRDQEEFASAEFFPVPPILPDPARRPDFAKVARLANQLKRGISDTLPFYDLAMVALDLLHAFRAMVMSQMQWQDYREALRRPARRADGLALVDGIPKRVILVLVLVDGTLKRVILVLVLVNGILKRVLLVPVRLQDGKIQVRGLPRGAIDLEPARCRNATRSISSPRQLCLNSRNSRIFPPSQCPRRKASRRTRRMLITP
ncbi:hypothetical protein Ae201684P_007846 [Aphanomyces euteiches]|uniref:Uncharacterized protein n=1 Tax=Aphanomyces euteiches TaxID=100861 RepID=A0A6G0W3G6_9STRA|nr:hypothetical protein Ae201684_019018 [Aphanomyces euteiches]KAH9089678.1 hypothetical protein Ae201684P_007846 [Aphanomyces euteiches]